MSLRRRKLMKIDMIKKIVLWSIKRCVSNTLGELMGIRSTGWKTRHRYSIISPLFFLRGFVINKLIPNNVFIKGKISSVPKIMEYYTLKTNIIKYYYLQYSTWMSVLIWHETASGGEAPVLLLYGVWSTFFFYCHYTQVPSGSVWYYVIESHLWIK